MKDLEKTLTELISGLKPLSLPSVTVSEHWFIEFDGTEKDNRMWLSHIADALKSAKTFEIHCCNEETQWIDIALRYGVLKASDWKYGKIIVGNVTPEFTSFLLGLPKPTDTELCNKMTPFFTIVLDNGFCSAHYGTELSKE